MSNHSIHSGSLSLISQRSHARASGLVAVSLEKMATGLRINRGTDDPAGMISSEQLSAALASLEAESRAAERTNAVANVAEGALSEISGLLGDANTAAVANANTAGMSQAERDANQMEIDSALQAVDRIASTTKFNGQRVLDGSMTLTVREASQAIPGVSTALLGQVTIDGRSFALEDAKTGRALDSSRGAAAGAQEAISAATRQVATLRGEIGAFQQDAIGPTMRHNAVAFENTAAAHSQIQDTNYAAESARLAREQVLARSSLWAMALANSEPGRVLEMVR